MYFSTLTGLVLGIILGTVGGLYWVTEGWLRWGAVVLLIFGLGGWLIGALSCYMPREILLSPALLSEQSLGLNLSKPGLYNNKGEYPTPTEVYVPWKIQRVFFLGYWSILHLGLTRDGIAHYARLYTYQEDIARYPFLLALPQNLFCSALWTFLSLWGGEVWGGEKKRAVHKIGKVLIPICSPLMRGYSELILIVPPDSLSPDKHHHLRLVLQEGLRNSKTK